MRWLAILGAVALGAAPALPASAQRELGEEEARRNIPHYDAMKAAAARGREMYRYDQAAWHATDSFVEAFDMSNSAMMRGYVVLPGDGGLLDTVFYGEADGALVEVARYTVDGSRVVGGGLLPDGDRPRLSALAVRMAAARVAAVEEAEKQGYERCNEGSFNSIVMPGEGNQGITVYLLTAPLYTDAYPVGGHYRIDIGVDGQVAGSRRFLNTCFVANYGDAEIEDGSAPVRPEALVLTHLLDPQPTEIHVFASYYIPVMLMIATTENGRMWSVRQAASAMSARWMSLPAIGTRPAAKRAPKVFFPFRPSQSWVAGAGRTVRAASGGLDPRGIGSSSGR